MSGHRAVCDTDNLNERGGSSWRGRTSAINRCLTRDEATVCLTAMTDRFPGMGQDEIVPLGMRWHGATRYDDLTGI